MGMMVGLAMGRKAAVDVARACVTSAGVLEEGELRVRGKRRMGYEYSLGCCKSCIAMRLNASG